MLIEFYGLPGSGKTTVAKKMAQDSDGFIYLHASDRGEIFRLFPSFFIQHPFISLFWIKEVFFCSPLSLCLIRYKMHRVLVSLIQYQKADFSGAKNVVIDEGALQRILSIYEDAQDMSKIKRCIANVPKVDLIAITNWKGNEFKRHISDRVAPQSRNLNSWMRAARENDKLVKEALSSSGRKVVYVAGKSFKI